MIRTLTVVISLCLPLLAAAQKGEDIPPRARTGATSGVPSLVDAMAPHLEKKFLKGAKVGIYAVRLDSGDAVYGYHEDTLLHPASNTKIVTVAAALSELGLGYKYRTDLVAEGYERGTAKNVYFIGRGDPGFVSESLWKLVDDAHHRGLRTVTGDIVVDATHFTTDTMAPGFEDKNQDSAYRAATGAASLNFNAISIRIRPGKKVGAPVRVDTRPPGGYAIIRNSAKTTTKSKDRLGLKAKASKGRTALVIEGSIGIDHAGVTVRRRIDAPALFTGYALKAALERAGIKVRGKVRVGGAPSKTRRMARVTSRPLAALVADVNKFSNNFMAEHLVRTLGKVKGKAGDWAEGGRVVSRFLREKVGIDGFRYINGSGLFGKTAFSAKQLVTLLQAMHNRRPALPEFAASLAIGGVDGTLRRRFKSLAPGSLRAKTGTLNGVICLSGYFQFADGSPGAFSILVNDVKAKPWSVWQVQDAVLKVLMGYTPPRG